MRKPKNHFTAYFFLLGLLGASAGLAIRAQSPQGQVSPSSGPPPPPKVQPNKNATIHATVNLVQIDVQVLDRDGKPLKGLKPEQFSVTEDTRPQKISTFDYYDVAAIETASSQDRNPLTIPIGSVAPPESSTGCGPARTQFRSPPRRNSRTWKSSAAGCLRSR